MFYVISPEQTLFEQATVFFSLSLLGLTNEKFQECD